jgi:glycosyltransferase involved in cell wall biosynthesis
MGEPQRILFVEASTGGVVGGSLTGILPLIAHLDRSRFTPALALFEPKAIATDGFAVHVLPPLPRPVGSAARGRLDRLLLRVRRLYAAAGPRAGALAQLYRREQPALVYLANGFRANLDGVIAARRCGLPVICHEKGFEPVGPVERLTSQWIDACVCMTDEIAEYCRARGVHARRLLTIYDGIDCDAFRPGGGTAIRREFGIPLQAPVTGIVGHIQDWKGQHLVVEAVARARRRFPELRCLVVGGVHRRGVEYAARLRERIAAPDLAGHVILTGPRDDVAACLDAMDVVLHASVVPEPFGRVLIEAMALARPVIAPREGGPLVIVADGETGMLVPPRDPTAMADALVALLADPARRTAMGRAGRARAEAVFDIRRHVQAMEALFDEVLAAHAGRRGAG